jgi:Tol biopolymer transport system component
VLMMFTRLSVLALFLGSVPIAGFSGDSQKSGGHAVNNAGISIPAPPPDPKQFRKIVALSAKGHWTFLGTNWLITDGQFKELKFPLESLHPSPLSLGFFDDQKTLIYSHGPVTATTGTLALFDISTASYRDIAALPDQVLVPSLSPDKRHVAFVNTRGRLKVVDLETKELRDLAAASTSNPSWSPDGRSIAFEKNREHDQGLEYSQVAVVALTSGEITVLDKGHFPSWSPKGDLIAYTDLDGKELKVIDPQGKQGRVLKKNWAAIMGPIEGPLIWSPDEKQLIFSRVHDSLSGEAHNKIYVLDIASGDMTALTRDAAILAWR